MEIKSRGLGFCYEDSDISGPWKVRYHDRSDTALNLVMGSLIRNGVMVKGCHCDLIPKVNQDGYLVNSSLLVATEEEDPPVLQLLNEGSVLLVLVQYNYREHREPFFNRSTGEVCFRDWGS
jgi:hypothetical protein